MAYANGLCPGDKVKVVNARSLQPFAEQGSRKWDRGLVSEIDEIGPDGRVWLTEGQGEHLDPKGIVLVKPCENRLLFKEGCL